MIRNFVTRRHRFLAISLGMAATLAMLGLAFNITEADIDTDRHFRQTEAHCPQFGGRPTHYRLYERLFQCSLRSGVDLDG